jgi:hypothetical protein
MRWRGVAALRAFGRAAGGGALVVFAALIAYAVLRPTGVLLVALGAIAGAAVVACFGWMAWSLRNAPGDQRVARYVEERYPDLEDRLATAVEFADKPAGQAESRVRDWLVADVVSRLRALDWDQIVSPSAIRRAALVAAAGAAVLLIAMMVGRTAARRAYDAAFFYAFPSQLSIEVTPGDARVRAGEPLKIGVRLRGGSQAITPTLTITEGQRARTVSMVPDDKDEAFAVAFESVIDGFTYHVAAGRVTSPEYSVRVLRMPRVARIDLQYEYPAAYKLKPRVEEDSGDIYAPAGTRVRLRVQADKAIDTGDIVMTDGARVPLRAASPEVREGEIQVAGDGSYRIALTDADGLTNPGETEYFIRSLEDRPPDVRILRPRGDQEVTRLEEVPIEASADDDFGIQRFELAYSVRGGPEKTVPFKTTTSGTTTKGGYTLYLEDLDVAPGDFVTYYARARDVARGGRSTEVRSDIFFLEVKPYDEEFVAAQSQAGMGAGMGNRSIENLTQAQKEIIVATWKLDRRALDAKARSEQDIRAVARAQGELKGRLDQMTGQIGLGAGSDTSGRSRGRRGTPGTGPGAGAAEDVSAAAASLVAAGQAMGRAEGELNALKTPGALPHEMEALNQLLKADAEVRRREVARQQNSQGQGSSGSRAQRDLSSLFDRELRRQQENNYETPTSAEQREESPQTDALDKIRDLARRQEQFGRELDDLAERRAQLSAEELKRRLETLTREQSELRRQAEELSRRLPEPQQAGQQQSGQQQAGQQQSGQPQSGQQQAGQQQAGRQQGGQAGQSGGQSGQAMRGVTEEMASVAGELRRQDPAQAGRRSEQALERLREIERQLMNGRPEERRRAMSELQFETNQLAEAERQVASETERLARGGTPGEGLRKLGGEQERLADRMQQLERNARRLAGSGQTLEPDQRASVGEAVKQLDREQLERRMRDSAAGMLKAGEGKSAADPREPAPAAGAPNGNEERDIASALDRIARRLGAPGGTADAESKQLAGQLAATRDMQDRLRDLEQQIDQLQRQIAQATQSRGQQAGARGTAGDRQGQSQNAGTGGGGDLNALQEQLAGQLRRAEELSSRIGERDDGSTYGGRYGGTPEAQRLNLSAPGTEAFKQDFAKWEILKKNMNDALEQTEMSLTRRLAEKESQDRLNAGADDRAPGDYERLVDRYFQSLAGADKK